MMILEGRKSYYIEVFIKLILIIILTGCGKQLLIKSVVQSKSKPIKTIKSYEWRAPNEWHNERVFNADTILFLFDIKGRQLASKMLYYPHDERNWGCDSTFYRYDNQDSLILKECYTSSKKEELVIKTTKYIRDSLQRVVTEEYHHSEDDFYGKTTIYKYDSSGKSFQEFIKKRGKKEVLNTSVDYIDNDSLQIKMRTKYKSNGTPTFKTIDSISCHSFNNNALIKHSKHTIELIKGKIKRREVKDPIYYYYKNSKGQIISEIELCNGVDTVYKHDLFYHESGNLNGKLERIISNLVKSSEIHITDITYNKQGNWTQRTTRKDSTILHINYRTYTYWEE